MNRYINLKWRPFKVDVIDLNDWLTTTFGDKYKGMISTKGFCQVLVSPSFSQDDNTSLMTHYNELTENGENVKLAKPSRLAPDLKAARDMQIKQVIATKDWSAMSVAERKFAMGATVTSNEYDSLAVS